MATIPSPINPEDMPRIVAELQAQAQAQADEKQVKAIIDITTKTFDRATAYNNVILVAGYAGAFTVWSFTRSQLPAKAGIAIALALLISLAAFVLFEVVKMTATSILVIRKATVLRTAKDAHEKLQALKDIDEAHTATLYRFMMYWRITMAVAVAGALIALGLLTYNFLAVLLEWPAWPM